MLRHRFASIVAALVAAFAVTGPALAQVGADLNISPKRVVFDERTRSAVVYVFNQGDQEATYTVSLVDRIMLPGGEIIEAGSGSDPDVASAADLIQYAPRRVVLGPRESQAIRIRARLSGDGASERRTHLTVTAIPDEAVGFTVDQAAQEDGELSIRIVALFSLSIPLIVREGGVDARAAIEAVEATPAGVIVDLARLGANSVYGDIEVHATRDDEDVIVAQARGVAVYPEAPGRRVMAPLLQPLISGETLRVVYRDGDTRPGEELAATGLRVP